MKVVLLHAILVVHSYAPVRASNRRFYLLEIRVICRHLPARVSTKLLLSYVSVSQKPRVPCQVIPARVPIIKCRVAGGAGGRAVAVDISLGVANGAAAVGYLSRAVAAVPGLRPLVRLMHGLGVGG